MIFSIDPGNEYSAYVLLDEHLTPIAKGKVQNEELLKIIQDVFSSNIEHVAIEMVASYGMPVGATVFETCVWIGRFYQAIHEQSGVIPKFIYRKDEKINLCGSLKAKDSNVVQALIDRFAPNTPNKGKGSKKEQGFFYGFAKDIWQAYAVAITYHDKFIDKETTRLFI